MKKNLLILITLCITTIGYSQTFTDNFITYVVTGTNEVTTANYSGGAVLTIPATVTNSTTTYNVVAIGLSSFSNKLLTSVVIPNSVTSIDHNAFRYNQLASVTIPNSVTSIGQNAFNGNSTLTCVTSEGAIPPTVFTGGNDSFTAFRWFVDLSIPTGTASAYAAAQWTGFNSVAEGLTGTFVVDNITYQILPNPNNEVTITDYNTAGGTAVTIPTSVNSACTDFSVVAISNNAFNNDNLTNVTIPNSVITIGISAFAFNDLTSLTIPDSVLTIGDAAFVQNNNMTNVVIGNSVTSIGGGVFRFNALTSVTIPNSVTSIGTQAFESNNINNLVFGTGLTNIGNSVFRLNNLTNVTIPNSVTNIGVSAFQTNNINNLVISNSVITIDAGAFANNDLTSVIIPDSVTNIGTGAFADNDLTSVTIPDSVTNIGDSTFQNNPLTDVFSESLTPPIITTGGAQDTFGVAERNGIHLHIPASTMGAYVTDAGALWTGFNPVTEDALSVSDFELTNNIKIITTTDAIKIVFSNSVRLQNYTIYSISGAKVATGTESEIATTSFASGIYILKLDFDKGTVVKKLVIN